MAPPNQPNLADEKRKRVPVWNAKSDIAKYVRKNGRHSRLAVAMYLVFRRDLRAMELRLALYLTLRCDFRNYVRISGKELADAIGSTNSNHILKSAKRLAWLGLIERQDEHPKKCAYRLPPVFRGMNSLLSLTEKSRSPHNPQDHRQGLSTGSRVRNKKHIRGRRAKMMQNDIDDFANLWDGSNERSDLLHEFREEAERLLSMNPRGKGTYLKSEIGDDFEDDE